MAYKQQQKNAIKFDFNPLKMYFNDDFKINDKIIIHQPTIQEIVDWDDNKYYSMVYTLCSIPSDMKSFLFDNNIDWEELSDFEFFISISRAFTKEETSIIFGNTIDFSKMEISIDKENGQVVLYDKEKDIVIDAYIYQRMIDYLRKMHAIVPLIEKSINKRSKMALIEYDRDLKLQNSNSKSDSILLPLISSMINSAGFKYKKSELKEVGIFEFMDSVQRIQVIMSTDALIKGMYSGMVDTKKIEKKEFNWMRELTVNSSNGENLKIPSQN